MNLDEKYPMQFGAYFLTPKEVEDLRFRAGLRAFRDAGIPSEWAKPLLLYCMKNTGLEADRVSFLLTADKEGLSTIIDQWKRDEGKSEKGAVVFRLHSDLGKKQLWRIRRASPKDAWLYSYYEAYYLPLCFNDFMKETNNV